MIPADGQFLAAFAAWLAGRAGVEHAATPRALWLHRVTEGQVGNTDNTTPIYSVLRQYDAEPLRPTPRRTIAVQCKTIGLHFDQTLGRAQTLFAALCADDGSPVRAATLPAFVLIAVLNPRSPFAVGVDDKGRQEIVSNFDLAYRAA